VSLLVRDTVIDYDKEKVYTSSFPTFLLPFFPLPVSFFIRYCKNTYGIDGDEIKYVWNQYRNRL
jgi:hypothetical protein